MLRALFLFLVFSHGLIHLMGFAKAFGFAAIKELSLSISKPFGVFWLIAFLLFIATAVLFVFKNDFWWLLGFMAVLCSQILIFYFWQDARFGTIANVLILFAVIVGFASWNFENSYREDVKKGLEQTHSLQSETITESDLQHLPQPVQKYLHYVGIMGKPKIKNFKIEFKGELRGRGQDWFPFTSEQYNFMDDPKRLFFIKAKVKGLPTRGYHAYQNGKASMLIKALSLFPVMDFKGGEMDTSETVTYFNDLCLFAPAMLCDKNIRWEAIDSSSAKATFTNKGIAISAILYFNEQGELIDFLSEDRYDMSDRKKYTFSTPAGNYQYLNGYKLCSYGEAVWHYPDGKFTYGKFVLKSVNYNL